jgi:hypothetical protein
VFRLFNKFLAKNRTVQPEIKGSINNLKDPRKQAKKNILMIFIGPARRSYRKNLKWLDIPLICSKEAFKIKRIVSS